MKKESVIKDIEILLEQVAEYKEHSVVVPLYQTDIIYLSQMYEVSLVLTFWNYDDKKVNYKGKWTNSIKILKEFRIFLQRLLYTLIGQIEKAPVDDIIKGG